MPQTTLLTNFHASSRLRLYKFLGSLQPACNRCGPEKVRSFLPKRFHSGNKRHFVQKLRIYRNADVLASRNKINIEEKRKIGSQYPIEPPAQIKLDNTGHWPIIRKFRGTCRIPGCSSRDFTKCEKCNMCLCTNNKLCFKLIIPISEWECTKKLAEKSAKLTLMPNCLSAHMYNFNFDFVT